MNAISLLWQRQSDRAWRLPLPHRHPGAAKASLVAEPGIDEHPSGKS